MNFRSLWHMEQASNAFAILITQALGAADALAKLRFSFFMNAPWAISSLVVLCREHLVGRSRLYLNALDENDWSLTN